MQEFMCCINFIHSIDFYAILQFIKWWFIIGLFCAFVINTLELLELKEDIQKLRKDLIKSNKIIKTMEKELKK